MPEFWVLLHLWHWEMMVRKALFLGTTWKQKCKDKNPLVNLRTMVLLFFNICMHLRQQSAKERCSWWQFVLKKRWEYLVLQRPKCHLTPPDVFCLEQLLLLSTGIYWLFWSSVSDREKQIFLSNISFFRAQFSCLNPSGHSHAGIGSGTWNAIYRGWANTTQGIQNSSRMPGDTHSCISGDTGMHG